MCDDAWGTVDASVACRQLGYSAHSKHVDLMPCFINLLTDHAYSISTTTKEGFGAQNTFLIFFFTTDATAYSFARYGRGTGPIHLDNVACTGTEDALVNCTYDSDTSDCSHFEDASVLCQREHSVIFVL